MIVLDEHLPPSQRQLLRSWGVRVCQIGHDAGQKGMQDEEIIPLLRQLRRPTFVTLDAGFYERHLCHARYCLAVMSVKQVEVARFVRRLLRHPDFNTQAKRMGAVIRLSHASLVACRLRVTQEVFSEWTE